MSYLHLKKDLSFFATKCEIKDIDDKITAQAEEITQLCVAVNTQDDRPKQFEVSISKHAIALTACALQAKFWFP